MYFLITTQTSEKESPSVHPDLKTAGRLLTTINKEVILVGQKLCWGNELLVTPCDMNSETKLKPLSPFQLYFYQLM